MSSIVVVHEHSGREGRGVGEACKKPVKTSTTIIIIIIWGRGLVEMMPPYMAIYVHVCVLFVVYVHRKTTSILHQVMCDLLHCWSMILRDGN